MDNAGGESIYDRCSRASQVMDEEDTACKKFKYRYYWYFYRTDSTVVIVILKIVADQLPPTADADVAFSPSF
jgi:hypothetical protein